MDALNPCFKEGSFDAVLCAYGDAQPGFRRRRASMPSPAAQARRRLHHPGILPPTTAFTRFFYNGIAPLWHPVPGLVLLIAPAGVRLPRRFHTRIQIRGEYRDCFRHRGFRDVSVIPCDFGISHIVTAVKGRAMGRYVIGVTGASGAIYADRLLMHLKDLGQEVHLVLTEMGKKVCAYEGFPDIAKRADKVYDNKDFFAPISSGSYLHQGMAVVPCSMGTLGKIAHGIGDSLLTRAADVCMKEKRRLVIVPRETPMSALHLQQPEGFGRFRQRDHPRQSLILP